MLQEQEWDNRWIQDYIITKRTILSITNDDIDDDADNDDNGDEDNDDIDDDADSRDDDTEQS